MLYVENLGQRAERFEEQNEVRDWFSRYVLRARKVGEQIFAK